MKRTVTAPNSYLRGTTGAIVSVQLEDDEEVEWHWTHPGGCTSGYVSGYTVKKKPHTFVEAMAQNKLP